MRKQHIERGKNMKLLETKATLEEMLTVCTCLSRKHKEAIKRALIEVEITIENGDESNL
jgi:hypothetical protein